MGVVFVNRASFQSSKSQLDAIANRADDTVNVFQDTGSYTRSTLFDRVSGMDNSPKDDMAVFDKAGRLLAYFDHPDSNWGMNKVSGFLMKVLNDPNYKNPCGALPGGGEESEDSKDSGDDTICVETMGKLKGTKVPGKNKTLTSCDCRDKCKDQKGFSFKPHKKEGKKGKCTCYSKVKKVLSKGNLVVEEFEE